jgi:hypothetical protein
VLVPLSVVSCLYSANSPRMLLFPVKYVLCPVTLRVAATAQTLHQRMASATAPLPSVPCQLLHMQSHMASLHHDNTHTAAASTVQVTSLAGDVGGVVISAGAHSMVTPSDVLAGDEDCISTRPSEAAYSDSEAAALGEDVDLLILFGADDSLAIRMIERLLDLHDDLQGMFAATSRTHMHCRLCPTSQIIIQRPTSVQGLQASLTNSAIQHCGGKIHIESVSAAKGSTRITSYFAATASSSALAPAALQRHACCGFYDSTWQYTVKNPALIGSSAALSSSRFVKIEVDPMVLINDLDSRRSCDAAWHTHPDGDNGFAFPHYRSANCRRVYQAPRAASIERPQCRTCATLPDLPAFRLRVLRDHFRVSAGGPGRGHRTVQQAGGYMTLPEVRAALRLKQDRIKQLLEVNKRLRLKARSTQELVRWYNKGDVEHSLMCRDHCPCKNGIRNFRCYAAGTIL